MIQGPANLPPISGKSHTLIRPAAHDHVLKHATLLTPRALSAKAELTSHGRQVERGAP